MPHAHIVTPQPPRWLQIAYAPQRTLQLTAQLGTGFGILVGLLALEYVLTHPANVAAIAYRGAHQPLAAIASLWSHFVNDAAPAALAVCAAGVVLYYNLRLRNRRLDLWPSICVASLAWAPHTYITCLGTALTAAGWGQPWLPPFPFAATGDSATALLKGVLTFGPTVGLWGLAALTVRPSSQDGDTSAEPPPQPPRTKGQHLATRASQATLLALVAVALLATMQQVHEHWSVIRPVVPGDTMPTFTLAPLAAGTLQTPAPSPGAGQASPPERVGQDSRSAPLHSSNLAGKIVLIDFWATWCGPCIRAMPKLQHLHSKYQGRNFRLLSVNIEPYNQAEVAAFATKHRLSFPIYVDNGQLQRRFHVSSFPTLFLVDAQQQVRGVWTGSPSYDRIEGEIQALLNP